MSQSAYDDVEPGPERQLAKLREQLDQVDDVLVVNWITVKDGDYRKALHDLVTWNIQIHDDPAVSEVAAKRQAEIDELKATISGLQRSLEISRKQTLDAFERVAITHNECHALRERLKNA
jgi:hypothetical protein